MKRFNEDFKTKLYSTIEDIENNSLVEIVSIIKARSGKYTNVSLWAGITLMILAYTFFMFAPINFDVYLIYFMTLLSFLVGYWAVELINPLQRILIRKKVMKRNVELYGRAIFQKGGIRHTNEKIGVLIFVSLFEKEVFILPDKGAETMVPAEDWNKINKEFQSIFESKDIPTDFLEKLNSCKDIFSEFIPPIENDINELPDDLDVEI